MAEISSMIDNLRICLENSYVSYLFSAVRIRLDESASFEEEEVLAMSSVSLGQSDCWRKEALSFYQLAPLKTPY